MQTYRLFIAAEIPSSVREVLAGTQERLRSYHLPVKWVAPEAMHLTLHFLGETDVTKIAALGATLRKTLEQYAPFELSLAGVGAFPNLRRPNVVWVGVAGSVEILGRIQSSLGDALEAFGLPREMHPFRAHLTIGRLGRESPVEQQTRLGDALRALPPFEPICWQIDRIILFRSDLRSKGPMYTALEVMSLPGRR